MSRIAKSVVAIISGLALMLGLVSAASAKPSPSRNSGTKVVKTVNKSTKANAAAKKAAAKRAAAKKLAAKKAAAKKAAAKRAAAKKAAIYAAAAKKATAAKKAAESRKQAARKALMNDILDSLTPVEPTELPTPDPSSTEGSAGGADAMMPAVCMPIAYDSGFADKMCRPYKPYPGKPTAAQLAFNEALALAHSEQAAAMQPAYEAYESATVDARNALMQAWSIDASESQWQQIYLDFLSATREAQVELNAASAEANAVFSDAKFAAIAAFDEASFDATTDEGIAALASIADYRSASQTLELEQFTRNLSDSVELNDGIVSRMQAFVDELATLETEADITAARDAYYTDLSAFYNDTFTATSEYLQSFYDAVNLAEEAFVALTGQSPSHPEYYPWWWYGGEDPIIVIDPVPGDCVEEPLEGECLPPGETGGVDPVPCEGDECEVVPYLPPGETGGIDPIPGDKEPEIAICPPFPGEFEEYPRPLPPQDDDSDSSDNGEESDGDDESQNSDPVDPAYGPTESDCLAPVIQ
jgi:hypothetical protein